jgi:hypothetical protein
MISTVLSFFFFCFISFTFSSTWNYITNTSELEYQLYLNISFFQHNRAQATSDVLNWINLHLEQESHPGVPYVDIELDDVLPYSRNESRYHITPDGQTVLRHRFGIAGNRTRNEVIWKIVDYNGTVSTEYVACASQWESRIKIEFDLTCDGNTTALSSYARMEMSQNVSIITAGDVNLYFPNFTAYYGLDDSYVLYLTKNTDYVKDCDARIAGEKAEFSQDLSYDNYNDYLNDYLPLTSSRPPDFSIKMDKEDVLDWEVAMMNARAVYDYMLFNCPYIVQENCTEIDSIIDDDGKKNGSGGDKFVDSTGFIFVIAGVALVMMILTISLMMIYRRSHKQKSSTATDALIDET